MQQFRSKIKFNSMVFRVLLLKVQEFAAVPNLFKLIKFVMPIAVKIRLKPPWIRMVRWPFLIQQLVSKKPLILPRKFNDPHFDVVFLDLLVTSSVKQSTAVARYIQLVNLRVETLLLITSLILTSLQHLVYQARIKPIKRVDCYKLLQPQVK